MARSSTRYIADAYTAVLIAEDAHPLTMMKRIAHSNITFTSTDDRSCGLLFPQLESQLDVALNRVGGGATAAVSAAIG